MTTVFLIKVLIQDYCVFIYEAGAAESLTKIYSQPVLFFQIFICELSSLEWHLSEDV